MHFNAAKQYLAIVGADVVLYKFRVTPDGLTQDRKVLHLSSMHLCILLLPGCCHIFSSRSVFTTTTTSSIIIIIIIIIMVIIIIIININIISLIIISIIIINSIVICLLPLIYIIFILCRSNWL
jgi:hypothetical protein